MIEILIPLETPSQNVTDRQHWAVRKRFGKACEQWIKYAMRDGNLDVATKPRRVVITSYRKRRITDDANIRGGAKSLVDAIVRSGLLVDDKDTMARIEYRQELASKGPRRMARPSQSCTMIQIEDMQ